MHIFIHMSIQTELMYFTFTRIELYALQTGINFLNAVTNMGHSGRIELTSQNSSLTITPPRQTHINRMFVHMDNPQHVCHFSRVFF